MKGRSGCEVVVHVAAYTCSLPLQPDKDLILDRHPQYRNIIIGAGFSGMGSFNHFPLGGGGSLPFSDLSPRIQAWVSHLKLGHVWCLVLVKMLEFSSFFNQCNFSHRRDGGSWYLMLKEMEGHDIWCWKRFALYTFCISIGSSHLPHTVQPLHSFAFFMYHCGL